MSMTTNWQLQWQQASSFIVPFCIVLWMSCLTLRSSHILLPNSGSDLECFFKRFSLLKNQDRLSGGFKDTILSSGKISQESIVRVVAAIFHLYRIRVAKLAFLDPHSNFDACRLLVQTIIVEYSWLPIFWMYKQQSGTKEHSGDANVTRYGREERREKLE